MSSHVHICRETDTAVQCAHIMRRANIGFVPVVNAEASVVGVVTDRDLALRILAAGKPSTTRVQDVMTREVVSCMPDEEIAIAEDRMARAQVSRIVVTGAFSRCIGVISLSDVTRLAESGQMGRVFLDVVARDVLPPATLG
jgi:CBS domain-containing protein